MTVEAATRELVTDGIHKIYVGRTAADAHLVRAFLEENGIATRLHNDVNVAYGMAAPEVWIEGYAVARAIELLATLGAVQDGKLSFAALSDKEGALSEPDSPDAKCPSCGEQIPGNFSTCWNCGNDRA